MAGGAARELRPGRLCRGLLFRLGGEAVDGCPLLVGGEGEGSLGGVVGAEAGQEPDGSGFFGAACGGVVGDEAVGAASDEEEAAFVGAVGVLAGLFEVDVAGDRKSVV